MTVDVPPSDTTVWRAVVRVLRSPLHTPLLLLTDSLCCALFPDTCRLCGNPLLRFGRTPVCEVCIDLLGRCALKSAHSGSLCYLCGEDIGMAQFTTGDPVAERERRCEPCRVAPPPFRRAIASGIYQGEMRSFIHLLKYDGIVPVADGLGRLLATTIATLYNDAPADLLVVPVPLFAAKQRQRGYNQAALLAISALDILRSTHRQWKLQFSPRALMRRRATDSQAGLSSHQRRGNVRGAFFVPQPRQIVGRDVLLIDDIYTTGATVRACSKALLATGAVSVWVATVARAQREGIARFDAVTAAAAGPKPLDVQEPGAVTTYY